ncbi:MAG: LbetaH domain-containing protein [Chloroflexota bacterium]
MSGEKSDDIQPIGYIPMPGTNTGSGFGSSPEPAPANTGQAAALLGQPAQSLFTSQAPAAPARPAIDPSVRTGDGTYVDPRASVQGDVTLGAEVYVAPMVSIRADTGAPVRIGNQSNVQDGVVIHSAEGQSFAVDGARYAVYIGSRVSLTHQCLVHGPAALHDDVLVGFGSMVINSTVGKGTVIMHMAFVSDVDVPAGRMVPPNAVVNTPEQARALPRVPSNVREWADGVARGNRDRARKLSKAGR